MTTPLTLYAHTGEPRVALWCDEHALPHRFEVDITFLSERGAQTVTAAECLE